MSSLYNIEPFDELRKDAIYLLLIHPENIPHLGISVNNLYYSITYKSNEFQLDFIKQIEKLKKRKIPFIVVELSSIEGVPEKEFCKYEKAIPGVLTCFTPIRLSVLPQSNSEFIYQLIPELYENNLILNVFQYGLDMHLTKDNNFKLNEYSKESIYSYIQGLNQQYDNRRKNRFEAC